MLIKKDVKLTYKRKGIKTYFIIMDVNKNLFKNASTCEEKIGKLTGSALPAWIRGNVLYNGPCGVYDYDNMTVNHWFDGLSVMSLFKIKNDGNEISFTKKLLESETLMLTILNMVDQKGSIKPPSSTFLLHRSPSTDNFTPKDATDNCACNFYQYGNLTMASTETAFDRIIDPDTLETGDLVDMSNLVNIKTGRPLRDHNGDLYNVAASFVAGLKYHFIKFPKPEEGTMYARDYFPSDVKFVATLPTRFPHHLSQGRSFKECLEWMPSENNRFYIIDKSSGRNMEIKYMTDEPFYFLNFINCYECDYQEDSIDLNGGKWKEATAIRSHNTITLHGSVLCDHKGMEHPKVNPNFLFRKYNFSYVVGWMHSLDGDCHFANAVTKIDVETGMTLSWRTDDEYCHPSEVVFVPNPAGTSEDDGVLISCVSNAQDENEGYIVFISARNMKEIARASFDEAIPYGSHTFYIQK
ncbi:BCMO1 [Lepeophtheirus salmonis]|uniref:BCMO1 n=1 Tax=Lepeophtheirus salmonis TaxID=72036 RepID=A0A7R8H5W6_LEPSM|nr:BCMO1 [Lepeophtheirus salmonis]CAF2870740.1 BCMO1 [Lepeophtheirus salmonis]